MTDDRAVGAWLVGAVLNPLGAEARVVSSAPPAPEHLDVDALLLAAGSPLAREASARALAGRCGRPVLVLLGRQVEDGEGLRQAGAVPLRWPHSPVQVQEALLAVLGRDPRHRVEEPPGAPHIRR